MKTYQVKAYELIPQEVNSAGNMLIAGDLLDYDGMQLRVLRLRDVVYATKSGINFPAVEALCRIIDIDGVPPYDPEHHLQATKLGLFYEVIPLTQSVNVMRADEI